MVMLSNQQKGNGVIEMLLFAPLAVLFLFVAIDAGLAYAERASITNAIRMGLNSQALTTSNLGLQQFTGSGFELDESAAAHLVSETSRIIGENILRAQGLSPEGSSRHFKVVTSLLRIEVDPLDGKLLDYAPVSIASVFPSGSSLNLDSIAPDPNRITWSTFVEQSFVNDFSLSPSRFAVPLSPTFRVSSPSQAEPEYLPYSFALIAEVSALTRGIAPEARSEILAKWYSYREFQLSLLRTQVS